MPVLKKPRPDLVAKFREPLWGELKKIWLYLQRVIIGPTWNLDHREASGAYELWLQKYNAATKQYDDVFNLSLMDHGALFGLGDDDHLQYHNDARGDARYYQQSEFIAVSAGAPDVGKPIVLDAAGHVDASMINDADIDHGLLGGLGDDDHTQYVLVNGTRAMTGNLEIAKVAPNVIFTDLGGATTHNDWSIGTLVNDFVIQNIDSATAGYLVLDHFVRVYPNIPDTPVFGQYFTMLFDATANVTAVSSLGIFKDSCVLNMGGLYSNYTAMNASPTIRTNNATAGVAYLFISQPTTYTNTLGQNPAAIRSFDHRGNIESRGIAGATVALNMGLGDLSRCAALGTVGQLTVTDWITIGNFSAPDPGGYGLGVVFAEATCTCVVTNRIIFNAVDTQPNGEGGTETIVNQYGYKCGDLTSASAINCGAWIGNASGATANYGVVLDGDTAGAGIWFGDGQDASMYYDGTDLLLFTDLQNPSDFVIDCGTDKTLELTETVWDDLRIVPGAFQFAGVSDPTLSNWQPGASGTTFKIYKFQENDEVFFTCQLPHSYKEGTDIKAHLHWTPADRGNEENGNDVDWRLDYSWANQDGTFPSSATVAMLDTCDGTDDKHQMTPTVTISGTGKTVSSMLVCRLYRDPTNDTWVGITAAQSPAILEFDLHFEEDTMGSRQELVK